jgi:glycosyltransferase involved in cell wall biosynthesis
MKKVLVVASVASNLQQFNIANFEILKDLGVSIDVATNFNEGNSCDETAILKFKEYLESIGARHFQIDFSRLVDAWDQNKESYRQLLKLVEENNYDFIHCHTPVASAICRWVARKTKTKVIYTAHGFHFFKGAPWKYNLFLKSVERFLAHYTDMLITINNEDYKAAQKFRLRKGGKVKYIPGIGIDLKNADIKTDKEKKLKELGIPFGKKIVVTVAELIVRKNYPVALEAISKLNDDVYYIICGQGPLEADLKNLAADLKISDRVKFLGYRTDINEILSVADLFLFTTSQEGLPVSVMEAMSMGLPVVTSNVRGNRDLIIDGEGGFICDKSDSTAFADKMEKILSDDNLKNRFGNFNKERVKEFSKDKVNKLMKENFEEMLK